MNDHSYRDIIDIVNKLFVYTDQQDWERLQQDVFDEYVIFDVTSLGADAIQQLPAKQICEMWKAGFQGIDHIHHQAGNYIVDEADDRADVQAYAIASHYKATATKGKTRTFVGSYRLGLRKYPHGWRLDHFAYFLKYIDGNTTLE